MIARGSILARFLAFQVGVPASQTIGRKTMPLLNQSRSVTTSIRSRLITLSAVVAFLLFSTTLYIQNLVDDSSNKTLVFVSSNQLLHQQVMALKSTVQSVERNLYHFTLLREHSLDGAVAGLSVSMVKQADELYANPLAQMNGALRQPAAILLNTLKELQLQISMIRDLVQDRGKLYPAMPILLEELNPDNEKFLAAVEQVRRDSNKPTGNANRKVLSILDDLRFYWSQQIGATGLFVADRMGAFGEPETTIEGGDDADRKSYRLRIDKLLAELSTLNANGQLSPLQTKSWRVMQAVQTHYDEAFRRAEKMFQSDGWRSDLPLLKTIIRDLLQSAHDNLRVLEVRLDDMTSGSVVELVITQGVLSYFIWAFSLISYLILVGSYTTFEFSVRRPIMQVAKALQAYGEQGRYAASIKTNTEETEILVQAFKRMQDQVDSRQQRLESVLDNAGEGIITLNEKFEIETFNNAAQYVFAMGLDEVVGKPVHFLLADEERQKFIHLLKDVQITNVDDGETLISTMTGRRKSGETFPLSVKVSHLNLEGDEHFIVMAEDISERQAMMESLRHLAEHDSLTGLYNRQYFMDELDREVSRSHRNPEARCALLYIDLDNFKFVNDTLGHIAGDKVLIEVTMLLNRRMRKGDLLGRLGGDEFGLLLYEIDKERAVRAAEFFRTELAEYKFKYEGKVLDVGCSIGVALLEPEIDTKEDLLARADIACHIAKRLGKNRAYVYEDNDQENMDSMYADMGWARRIKSAIEENQFVFACQPIVDTASGETASYEVLLRMKDGKRNYVLPAGFLPSAERFGLMIDIDRWIIGRAIETLAGLQSTNEGMRYSINLSAKSICDKNILKEIKQLLEKHALAPYLLTFEITEDVAIANMNVASAFMRELQQMGCYTALDDFGVGYSSFSYLKELPVDIVKIDGSFVRNAETDPVNLAMVKAMNEVAHALGKKTVAEYVENEEIYMLLKSLGVDYVQGFHIGRPIIINLDNTSDRVKLLVG